VRRGTPAVRLLVTDVDGVLTDGSVYVDDNGVVSRRFSVRDGVAFELARAVGLTIAVISAKDCGSIRKRLEELRVDAVELGVSDKAAAVESLAASRGVGLDETCYIGDDLNDLSAMRIVGYSITVPSAPGELKEIADHVTASEGGGGAFREAVEHLLCGMGVYEDAMARLSGKGGV